MKKNILIIFVVMFASCLSKQDIHTISGFAQGSTYNITYIGEQNKGLQRQIDSIFKVIDLSMSTYIDNSIITKINKGEDVQIDAHFQKVLVSSKHIYEQSDGYFDPSLGVLFNIWGFGEKKEKRIPSQEQIDSVLSIRGMDKIEITRDNKIKKHKDIKLNFNAIAQGYTSDVIADFLQSKGYENFIVEVAGEIVVKGKNTIKNKEWTIGIDNPLQKEDERELIATFNLSDCAIATSGNYRKVWTDSISGQKFVHTINPKTGKPENADILSATIIDKTAMQADAYATAIMAMGLEKAKIFLKKNPKIKYLLIYSEGKELKQYRNI